MIAALKSSLKRGLAAANVFPTVMTGRDEIAALIKSLRPIKTDRNLIRLGPKGDGGYLVPDDLEGITACFSPGVSSVSGFEKDCAERGIKAFLADKSVDGPVEHHELFHFTKKFIGAISNDEFMTLDDWVVTSLPDTASDLLLQIDIEGYEYEVFLSTSDALMRRFRIVVAEFHNLEQVWNKPYFDLVRRAFEKVLQHHSCVHIHPNNCCGSVKKDGLEFPSVMEFTFLRNDRIRMTAPRKDFPHPLDSDNTANASMPLPECWYAE